MSWSSCSEKGAALIRCRAMDTSGSCFECLPINFETIQASFSESIAKKFMMALAYASPNDTKEFCNVVKDGVCADYGANTCCCGPEITEWQNCLITTDLATAVGQTKPCSIDCEPSSNWNHRIAGMDIVFGAIAMIALILLLVTYLYLDRCKNDTPKRLDNFRGEVAA